MNGPMGRREWSFEKSRSCIPRSQVSPRYRPGTAWYRKDASGLSMMVAGSPTGRFDARCFCTVLNRAQGGRSGACGGNLAHAVGGRHLIPAPASLWAKLAAILARMRLALYEPDIPQNTGTI